MPLFPHCFQQNQHLKNKRRECLVRMYDFLLVGAGLFNSVFAHEMTKRGKTCIVIEKRPNIGGNCYTYKEKDIIVHQYGAHIFRTNDREIWDYMNQFAEFNHFINSPIARYGNETYNMPFNMNTFSRMWGIFRPKEAQDIIRKQSKVIKGSPRNLEEHVISMVGTDIYEKLVKGYTEKQWGKSCKELPASIIRRIPLRFTYDNNYYNDKFQGIPYAGYTPIMKKMLSQCDIVLNTDYLEKKTYWDEKARNVIYTGTIDAYYDYVHGMLEYRSLRFETQTLQESNYQGVAVVNYTDKNVPYTRIIEHKHFEFGQQEYTVISKEYPVKWEIGMEAYYPVNDEANEKIYQSYKEKSKEEKKIKFCGRLGEYKYYDMQDTIKSALKMAKIFD